MDLPVKQIGILVYNPQFYHWKDSDSTLRDTGLPAGPKYPGERFRGRAIALEAQGIFLEMIHPHMEVHLQTTALDSKF